MYSRNDARRYIGTGNAWEMRVWRAVRDWYVVKFRDECPACGIRGGTHRMRCSHRQ